MYDLRDSSLTVVPVFNLQIFGIDIGSNHMQYLGMSIIVTVVTELTVSN